MPTMNSIDDGGGEDVLVLHERKVTGPTSIPASEFGRANIGHRPTPVPTQLLGKPSNEFTPADAAVFDWERRAFVAARVDTTDSQGDPDIRVPEYTLAEGFAELPQQDRERIHDLAERASEALSNVEQTLEAVRETVTDYEADDPDVPATGQVASVTRQAVGGVHEAEKRISDAPGEALDAAGVVAELQDATSVLVDLLSWGLEETDETAALREQAVGSVGVDCRWTS